MMHPAAKLTRVVSPRARQGRQCGRRERFSVDEVFRSGYMGQVVEWPEVITEGKTLEECREMLQDALHEMTLAYRQKNKEMPKGF